MKYLLVLALIYSSQVLSAEEFTPLTEQQINDQRQRFKQYVQQPNSPVAKKNLNDIST